MSDYHKINTIDAEKENLEIHVDLCSQRYNELHFRLTSVEAKMDQLSGKIDLFKADFYKVLIGSASTVVVAIIGGIFTLLQVLPK